MLIKLHTVSDNEPIFVNINTISHFYKSSTSGGTKLFTIGGTVIPVKETIDLVVEYIREAMLRD